jgi:dTDP-4-amino-4,6-dideoxygalactose transaminase
MNKKIDFLNLGEINKKYSEEFINEFKSFLNKGWFILGNNVTHFEDDYAIFSKTKYCIGVANGLDALILSLKVLGINKGDEVIVPSNTYIATWLAVSHLGAKVIPVEPKLETYNIDPDKVKQSITNATKAILVVNLYGQSAELDKLEKIAKENNIFLIEDNAQSQGAMCINKPTGSFGIVNATSFYPGKNLGALGDAGAITTNDSFLNDSLREIRNYGSKIKYYNNIIGYNSRLDELQAIFLRIKLKNLNQENYHRNKLANVYNEMLSNVSEIHLPILADNCTSVYHIYKVRCNMRDELIEYLNQNNINTMIHYPIPPHLQVAYKELGYQKGDFPIAENIAKNGLSLPMGPHLTIEDVEIVCEKIIKFFKKKIKLKNEKMFNL